MIKASGGRLAAVSPAYAPTCAVEFVDLVASTIIVRSLEREDAGDLLPSPMPGASPAALEQERTSPRASRAVQLRRHAEGIEDGELKASMETSRARKAAIAAELAPTGEHSPLAGIAGRPGAAQIRDGLPPGLTRQVIQACCQVPPAGFIAGTTAETYDPELITVNLRH
jgi:hypothetical protein